MKQDRWRYLFVRIVCDSAFSERDLIWALSDVGRDFFGLAGLSQMSYRVVRCYLNRGEAVLKCRMDSVDKLRATTTLLTHVAGQPAAAFVVRSSGTIKALTKATGHQ